MKRLILILAAFSLVLPLFGQEKSSPLKDQKDKVSYSLGLNIGFNLGRQNVPINPDALMAGIKDAIANKPQLTPDQIKETMTAFEKDMEQKQKAAADKNASEGTKFLEENKKKEGVKTTASGLQYKVVKEGTSACIDVSALSRPLPNRAATRHPKDPPGCKRSVYLGETRARLLAGNRAQSIGCLEIRQLSMVESRDPLLDASQFHLRSL